MQNFETREDQLNVSTMQSAINTSTVRQEVRAQNTTLNQEEAKNISLGQTKKFNVHFDSLQSCE